MSQSAHACGKMVIVTSKIHSLLTRVRTYPRQTAIIAGSAIVGLTLFGLVLVNQTRVVDFSYDGAACVNRLTVMPHLYGSTDDSSYRLDFKGLIGPDSWPLLSKQTCVEPIAQPIEGTTSLAIVMKGLNLPVGAVSVKVPAAPRAQTTDFIDKAISTTRPLEVSLSSPDRIHNYDFEVDEQSVACQPGDSSISCDITKLDLEQGKRYEAALLRSFKDQTPIQIARGELETLTPLEIVESSIESGHKHFDVPTEYRFKFSRQLDDQPKVQVVQTGVENAADIAIETTATGEELLVKLTQPLPREAKFEIRLLDIVGRDGSTLAEPKIYTIETSGGPSVAGVSVGKSSVSPGSLIVVTFDQPLAESIDVAKFARSTGVASVVRRHSANQISFQLQGGGLCAGFSLQVDKGLTSGSNSEVSRDAWKYDSRIVCGTSAVIGYSVRGRPIVAHYFGSGATTILFTGGIHGNELSSVQTMQGWVDYLYANAHQLPANRKVVVVPNLNPDGIAAGSRNNANNVNLGRNYPTANWQARIETASGTLEHGGGTSPGSEPETKAILALTRQLRPRLEVSFHSQGRLVGANKYADSVSIGNTYAATVGYSTMFYNAEAVMGYAMTGEYEDWMGEEMGIPAILIELPSHYGNYASYQLPALLKMVAI